MSPKDGKAICIHCGTPFSPTRDRTEFCCNGCKFVYQLIRGKGLERFYDLKDRQTDPVGSQVFHPRDYSWLERLADAAEKGTSSAPQLELELQGISCVGCVWLVEHLFEEREGALDIHVNSTSGRVALRWERNRFDVLGFARELQRFGYLLGPPSDEKRSDLGGLTKRLGLCAALAMNTMLFTLPRYLGLETSSALARFFEFICFSLATLSLLIGGTYFFSRSWNSIRRGILHIDLPISTGLLLAYAGSVFGWQTGMHAFAYFDFVAIFTFLMLGGRWVQQRAVEANRTRLLGARLTVPTVTPARGNENRNEVPATDITKGQDYHVKPGALVPLRSRLLSEAATFSSSWITGESESQVARKGSIVSSGTTNIGQAEISLSALEEWEESLLASLLKFPARAIARNRMLERILRWYLAAVLVVGTAGLVAWGTLGSDWLKGFQVLISVFVVSCPCAIGVALPLADELAVSLLRRAGVFVRESTLWTRLRRIRKLLLDKTGTLTLESLRLENPDALDALSPERQATLLRLVSDTRHPVGACLREQLLARGVTMAEAPAEEDISEVIGSGLELVGPEGRWRLGKPAWAGAREAGADQGHCLFSLDGNPLALFSFSEAIREGTVEELSRLRKEGYEVFLLSGDRNEKVRDMACRLGLPETRALGSLDPVQKAEWIREHAPEDALFVGDGANDSMAFDRALCRGTPAIDRGLLEQKADFYFLGQSLNGLGRLFAVRTTRHRAIRRVLGFTIAYNIATVTICLAGWMNPLLAAILMPTSSVISIALVAHALRR